VCRCKSARVFPGKSPGANWRQSHVAGCGSAKALQWWRYSSKAPLCQPHVLFFWRRKCPYHRWIVACYRLTQDHSQVSNHPMQTRDSLATARLGETPMLLRSAVCKCGQHIGQTQILRRSFVRGIYEAIYYDTPSTGMFCNNFSPGSSPTRLTCIGDGKIGGCHHYVGPGHTEEEEGRRQGFQSC
jgi:hypothetical protein